jgi:NADH-quinone oxidoreductase subunit F
MGVTLRELLELAGGMLDGRELKFLCPGGSSTPILPASALDTPYTYEDIAAAGSLLGTGALMFYSDQTSVVSVVRRFTEFYEHESCGKCTPCREGGYWASQILARIEGGAGVMEDLETLDRLCDSIFGRSFCALGDALTSPIASSLKYFRDEYVDCIQRGVGPTGTAPARDVPRMEPATVSGTARYRAELAALAASAVEVDA